MARYGPLKIGLKSSTAFSYMATIVDIISRSGLGIEVCHINQPNKTKLVLMRHNFHLKSHLKTVVHS